ncbi:unnamed protein product [Paramecium primaurelia]|uniref:Leucine-rich repeat protein n=1 Tax=Paramecium primaurelia TaxID=5886 RepID=A0A8S1LU11_PARPR|nr:unnamed protein product [Paramecium primaurelia]
MIQINWKNKNLNENQIIKLVSLKDATNLRALYISLEGLESFIELQILQFYFYKMNQIQNLNQLVNLNQLWLDNNLINKLRTSLDQLKNLYDLNINNIYSFKEALNMNFYQF